MQTSEDKNLQREILLSDGGRVYRAETIWEIRKVSLVSRRGIFIKEISMPPRRTPMMLFDLERVADRAEVVRREREEGMTEEELHRYRLNYNETYLTAFIMSGGVVAIMKPDNPIMKEEDKLRINMLEIFKVLDEFVTDGELREAEKQQNSLPSQQQQEEASNNEEQPEAEDMSNVWDLLVEEDEAELTGELVEREGDEQAGGMEVAVRHG